MMRAVRPLEQGRALRISQQTVQWITLLVALGGCPAPRSHAAAPDPTMQLSFESHFDSLVDSSSRQGQWMTSGATGWRTLPPNHEAEYYMDSSLGISPFSVQGGVLTISAEPGVNPAGLPYNSGMLTTYKSFSQLYGYFEMKARMPAGVGLWPAFWLLPADGSWPPEIDVVEQIGSDPQTIFVGTHSTSGGPNVGTTMPMRVKDTSNGFHTYGVLWMPDRITWYFDGIALLEQPTPADMHKPMYLLVNLAIGGKDSWPGSPDSRTEFPANLVIEYIRAYRQ